MLQHISLAKWNTFFFCLLKHKAYYRYTTHFYRAGNIERSNSILKYMNNIQMEGLIVEFWEPCHTELGEEDLGRYLETLKLHKSVTVTQKSLGKSPVSSVVVRITCWGFRNLPGFDFVRFCVCELLIEEVGMTWSCSLGLFSEISCRTAAVCILRVLVTFIFAPEKFQLLSEELLSRLSHILVSNCSVSPAHLWIRTMCPECEKREESGNRYKIYCYIGPWV